MPPRAAAHATACSLLLLFAAPAVGQDEPIDLIYAGRVEEFKKLLDGGLDPSGKDDFGEPYLYMAIGAEEVEIARLLIERGADVNARSADDGVPVFNNACYIGDQGLVDALLEKGADPKARDSHGGTALEDAAHAGSKAIAAKLRELGVETKWPLHVAAGLGDLETVRRLTADNRDDLVNKGRRGWMDTPLVFAAAAGQAEVVELLLKRGANPNLPDVVELFPLHYAAEDGSLEICRLLIAAGADVNAHVRETVPPLDWTEDEQVKKLLVASGAESRTYEQLSAKPGPSMMSYWRKHYFKAKPKPAPKTPAALSK